jgi:predicted RecB family nuclease
MTPARHGKLGGMDALRRKPTPDLIQQAGIHFDLETRLDTGVPWCFGYQCPGERTQVFLVDSYYDGGPIHLPDTYVLHVVEDHTAGWEAFAAVVESVPGPIYHWGSFEQSVLKKTAPAEVVAALHDRLFNLHKAFRQCFLLPVKGTGLKVVGAYLGFRWPPETDALRCWADYQAWLQESDRDLLTRAIAYNRADVEAMEVIRQWMLVQD